MAAFCSRISLIVWSVSPDAENVTRSSAAHGTHALAVAVVCVVAHAVSIVLDSTTSSPRLVDSLKRMVRSL